MSPNPTRILVIEDDPAIRRGLVDALGFAGYITADHGDGSEGLAEAHRSHAARGGMMLNRAAS